MSLLNDVLRDLAQQSTPADVAVQDNATLLSQSSLGDSSGGSSKKKAWPTAITIFVVVFFIALLVKVIYQQRLPHYHALPAISDNPIDPAAPLTSVAQPLVTPSDKKVDDPKPLAAASVTASTDVIATTEPSAQVEETARTLNNTPIIPDTTREMNSLPINSSSLYLSLPLPLSQTQTRVEQETQRQLIETLFQQANRAMAMDRLTSPIEDNAFSYYQKILSLQPDQSDALQGIETIALRYLQKADEQEQLGNFQQAETLIQRAVFVAPDFSRQTIEKRNLSVASGIHPSAAERLTTVVPANANENQPSIAANSVASEMTKTTETIKPFVVADAGSLSVTRDAASDDAQTAESAKALMQQGDVAQALVLLKNFIAQHPASRLSTLALADIYAQQPNAEALTIIAVHSEALTELDKVYLNAKLFALRSDNEAAISLLETHLAQASQHEDYRALLASLYYKQHRYAESLTAYQRLLSAYGDKAAYWLGLALAFDGLSQYRSALHAYQRVKQFSSLQTPVKQFIDQRITALSSQ